MFLLLLFELLHHISLKNKLIDNETHILIGLHLNQVSRDDEQLEVNSSFEFQNSLILYFIDLLNDFFSIIDVDMTDFRIRI
jgi:hypothetical protein